MWPNPQFAADFATFTEEILYKTSFFVQWTNLKTNMKSFKNLIT